jgi:hypothetical protein
VRCASSAVPFSDLYLLLCSVQIADALLALKHPNGGFLADLVMFSPERQAGPAKAVGRAFTVHFARVDEADAPRPTGHYVRLRLFYLPMAQL